jgi:hypothetical protein
VKGWLVCRAKPNVPNAGWLKITRFFNLSLSSACESLRLFVFKKVRWEKNKKHCVGLCVAILICQGT